MVTGDNSETLYSESVGEAFHSLAGAEGETLYNFIEGCEIVSRGQKQKSLKILEIGLGIGLGYALTMKALGRQFEKKITFITTEIDPKLLKWCQENTLFPEGFPYPSFRDLKKEKRDGLSYAWAQRGRAKLIVLLGDVRQTLPLAVDKGVLSLTKESDLVDCIYQDPFSPKRNPELWTNSWFRYLKTLCSKEAILSTYSASVSVRKSLIDAGFFVEKRKGFGVKRESTRAFSTFQG